MADTGHRPSPADLAATPPGGHAPSGGTTRQHRRSGALGRRLMWVLLAAIAIGVVSVLYVYGIHEPADGPGNQPPGGVAAPLPDGAGLPPPAK